MNAIETLKHEHQIALLVADAARREARSVQHTRKVNAERVGTMLDFFQSFVDRCHHHKEEERLFPRLVERGILQEGGPVGVMLHEHEEGRKLRRAAAEALPRATKGDAEAVDALAYSLNAFALLLRNHIDKEDNCLFEMAANVLTPDDQKDLAEAFERIEAEEMGEGVHEKYHDLAHELAES